MQFVPFEWYELERAVFVPDLEREQPIPIVYVSPEIRGKLYVATGDENEAIEELILYDIILGGENTCPTLFVFWEKQIFYANERRIWYPKTKNL